MNHYYLYFIFPDFNPQPKKNIYILRKIKYLLQIFRNHKNSNPSQSISVECEILFFFLCKYKYFIWKISVMFKWGENDTIPIILIISMNGENHHRIIKYVCRLCSETRQGFKLLLSNALLSVFVLFYWLLSSILMSDTVA